MIKRLFSEKFKELLIGKLNEEIDEVAINISGQLF